MKLRALPESFWKEPTSIQTVSHASSSYAVLPPLFSLESKNHGDVTCIRPVTPPDDKKNSPRHSPRSKKKIVAAANADTNLLFSLFDHLDTTNKIDQKLIVRRGRPKKSTLDKIPPPPSTNREEDPCIVDDIADKLFPELSLNSSRNNSKNKTPAPNYAMVRIKRGLHTMEFPAIKASENYGTILNELVTHM